MNDAQISLFYEEMGTGLPVIFLHGYPLNHLIWQPVINGLEDSARLILPDLRGHGKSPVPEGVYSMDLIARDLVGFMDDQKIDKAILVGHSMGGYVSLAFTKAYPDRLAGLGLVATQARSDSPEKKKGRMDSIQLVRSLGISPIVESMIPKLTSRADLHDILSAIMSSSTPTGIIGALQGIAEREDLTSWLENIVVPVVIIAGKNDMIVPIERAEEMTALIPNSWLVMIKEAGHMPMMETPERVVAACLELIHTVGAKSSPNF